MKCDNCNSVTVVQKGATYHYKECGIDRVYLNNIKIRVCEACGAQSPRIPRISEIHRTLGEAIALQPAPLAGADSRLLRKQLGLKAREWASLIGIDPATLSRWENGEQAIGTQSDLLTRLLYIRLRQEREGSVLSEPLADRLALATKINITSPPVVFIDANNPSRYLYQYQSK